MATAKCCHEMVPARKGLISIGGYNGEFDDTISYLSCAANNCTWSDLEEKMSIPRADFSSLMVPYELTQCAEIKYSLHE